MAGLRVEDLVREVAPVLRDPADPDSPMVAKITIRLGRTKTTTAEDDARVVVIGRAATALLDWLTLAKIESGAVFRASTAGVASARRRSRSAERERDPEGALHPGWARTPPCFPRTGCGRGS